MDLPAHQKAVHEELDKFMKILKLVLPKYAELLKKASIQQEEIKELGEIEYFLIEVTGRISEIKELLEDNVFGHSLNLYYQMKNKLSKTDQDLKKMELLRKTFLTALKKGEIISLN